MTKLGMDAGISCDTTALERIKALQSIVGRKRLKEILEICDRGCLRRRRLPNGFMVWFVLAMGLFCRDGYVQVFRWLKRFGKDRPPSRSALCQARQRLGIRPLSMLVEAVVQLLGTSSTPGAFYQGMRLMAIDGTVFDVPDTARNAWAFGRPGGGRAPGAFPQVRVLSLCEVGSHVFWRSLIKPIRCGEPTMVHFLLRFLNRGMLLLWDRNFLSFRTLTEVMERKAHLLAMIKKNLIFQPIRRLSDGSFLAKIYRNPRCRKRDLDGILVRIVEYTFDDPGRPGCGKKHRLLTTLLDAAIHPAKILVDLYHQRWEQELAFDELKTHQRERPVLRSQTPAGVVQEIYGLLLGHYVVRVLAHRAAELKGIDPRRISFTGTLKILRCRLPEVPKSPRGLRRWHRNLIAEAAQEVLPHRRDRVNPRVIKRKMSNWNKKRHEHRQTPQPTKDFRQGIVILI
jgi:hypothetical protein